MRIDGELGILNKVLSVGGSDLFVGLALPSIDSGGNGRNPGDPVLGLLDLDDGDVGGVDGELVGSAIGLVFGDLVDVDDPLLPEHLDHPALAALAGPSQHRHLVVLADRQRSDPVLFAQVFGQGRGHDAVADVRGGREVGSSLLSSAAADLNVSLHCLWR